MTTVAAPAVPAPERPRFTLPLLLLFLGSGCAALIYEVVWFHLLRFVVGGSAISLGFVLGSFMGGMCLGNLLLPRLLSPRWHPLRVYALLELGIGALGLLLPLVLPVLGSLYVQSLGHGMLDLVLRGTVCALALLPPTALMGATLPAMARQVGSSREGIAALGRCYGANIAGGVLGTLLAGFWLLRVHDTRTATWCAAAINAAVAALALLLALFRPFAPPAAAPAPGPAVPDATAAPIAARTSRTRTVVLVAIALSGFTALGAEVAWTRLLSLLFGASVYAFALILAVFLVGLGIGSMVGSRLGLRTARPGVAFACGQFLLVPALLWSAFAIGHVIPWAEPTYVLQEFAYQQPLVRFPWDFVRCAVAILPGPLCWGACFPLALAAADSGARDAGRLVGGVAAANTLGAIAGALLTSLWLIGSHGSQRTQQALALVAAGAALLLVATAPLRVWLRLLLCVLIGAGGAALARLLPPVPDGLIAWGRDVGSWNDADVDYRFVAEGVNASVAVTWSRQCLNFHVAGKVEASTDPTDMRLQRMLGHLPALVHGAPRQVLIVGCGAGVTAGTFCDYPSVERIVICELEPRVLDCARDFMADANGQVLEDPRTEVVLDDARHFLLTTRERFDVITSDPIHPWVRGAAALYSAEYYELVKQHLAPGGVVTQWVPLYQTDEASVKSQLGTFCRAFPEATLWSSDITGKGYDTAMMATQAPLAIDVDAVEALLEQLGAARTDLEAVELGSAVRLFSTYAGRARDLQPWLEGAQLNEDVALRLQYLAGLALDRYDDKVIFGSIKRYLRWPEELFTGSPQTLQELRLLLVK